MKQSSTISKRNFIVIAVTVVSTLIRIINFNYVASDFSFYLTSWMNTIEKFEGFKSFGVDVGNYTQPYLYILAVITHIPVNRLYAVKFVSCIFDYLLALGCSLIIYELTHNKIKQVMAYSLVVFCPTIILNSSCWAQCDGIYVTFLAFSLLYLIKDKPYISCAFFGISFVIKLQSIFFSPLLFILFLKKKVKIRHLLTIPMVYVLFVLPSIFAGRNIISAFTVYFNQTGSHTKMCLNAANLWGLVAGDSDTVLIACLSVLIISIACFIICRHLFSSFAASVVAIIFEVILSLFSLCGIIYSLSISNSNRYNVLPSSLQESLEKYGSKTLTLIAVFLAGCAVLTIIIFCLFKCKNIDAETCADLALLFALIIPFFLPRMHDRYFFFADALSIIYALRHTKRYYIPIFVISSSLYSYFNYLYQDTVLVQLPIASVIMVCAMILVVFFFFKDHIDPNSIKKISIESEYACTDELLNEK